jgi:hypothetical protein
VVIVATLIAAAVADNFDAPRVWWIVGVIASAYILSRGLAKSGTGKERQVRDICRSRRLLTLTTV